MIDFNQIANQAPKTEALEHTFAEGPFIGQSFRYLPVDGITRLNSQGRGNDHFVFRIIATGLVTKEYPEGMSPKPCGDVMARTLIRNAGAMMEAIADKIFQLSVESENSFLDSVGVARKNSTETSGD